MIRKIALKGNNCKKVLEIYRVGESEVGVPSDKKS